MWYIFILMVCCSWQDTTWITDIKEKIGSRSNSTQIEELSAWRNYRVAPATRSIYKLSTLWGKVYPVKQFKLLREASVSNSQNVVEQKVLNQPIQASTMMSVSFKNNRWMDFFENAPWYCQWIQIVQEEWPYGQNSDQIWSNLRLSMLESGTVIDRVRKRDKRLGVYAREREDWQRAKEWGTTPETDYHAVGFVWSMK